MGDGIGPYNLERIISIKVRTSSYLFINRVKQRETSVGGFCERENRVANAKISSYFIL